MIMVATRRLKEYARTNPLVIISNLARRRNCSEKEQTGLSTWSMTLLRVQLSIFGPGSRGWYLLYRCGVRWTSINFVLFSFLVCLLSFFVSSSLQAGKKGQGIINKTRLNLFYQQI